MSFIEQLQLLERMDQLIKMHATGTPKQFAEKLAISQSRLYDYINILKEMGGKIEYSKYLHSYIFKEDVGFKIGFTHVEALQVKGGNNNFS